MIKISCRFRRFSPQNLIDQHGVFDPSWILLEVWMKGGKMFYQPKETDEDGSTGRHRNQAASVAIRLGAS